MGLTVAEPVEARISRRDQIPDEIANIGNLRKGSLVSPFRKCGKPSCDCADNRNRGHRPHWMTTPNIERDARDRALDVAARVLAFRLNTDHSDPRTFWPAPGMVPARNSALKG